MQRLRILLWIPAILLAGCLPVRVRFGPGGRVATPNAVYKPGPNGALAPDLETMKKILARKPDGEGYEFRTLWSPDETRIAVLYSSEKAAAVVRLYDWPGFKLRGSARFAPGYLVGAQFSPSGRWLSFVGPQRRSKKKEFALYVIGDDGKPRELARNPSLFYDWEPGGGRIAVLVGPQGRDPGELGLGSLLVIDAKTGESRALLGAAFDEMAAMQWSRDGTIDFAMPDIQLPIAPKKIKKTRSSIYRVRVAKAASSPHAPVLAASAFGASERIYAFRRAPGSRERYLVVTATGGREPKFRAYLYEPGPQASPRRLEGIEPAGYAVPFWLDAETFGFPIANGYYRGKVAGEGKGIRSAVAGEMFWIAADGLEEANDAFEHVAEVLSWLDPANRKTRTEEGRALNATLVEAVRVGAFEPEQRPLAILVVGRLGGDDARTALRAAAQDKTALEGKLFGKGLTVGDFARAALARLEKGTPYPKETAPLFRLLP